MDPDPVESETFCRILLNLEKTYLIKFTIFNKIHNFQKIKKILKIALNYKILSYILKNLFIVVISGIKCEFAVQLSRGGD